MTDQSDTPRTGATSAQIERAARLMWDSDIDSDEPTWDEANPLTVYAMRASADAWAACLVQPGARIAEPEDLAAIRAALAVIAEMPVRTWASQGLTVAMIDRLVALAGEDEQP